MLDKVMIDRLKARIKEWEELRDSLVPLAPGANIDPIFKKIDDLHKELLEKLGYKQD